MTFNEYQKKSRETAIYYNKDKNYIYPTLGLVGEAGEIAEKIKKILRDNGGSVDEKDKVELVKELGDLLWYLSQLSTKLGLSLDDIAVSNIGKITSRKERGVLHGSGDNR